MNANSSSKQTPNSQTNFSPVVLLGFMGAGKTSVAAALAAKTNNQWVDLDKFIEKTENKIIAEIFENAGESQFREIETAALKEVLTGRAIGIVALGGGAWTIAENREIVRESGYSSVWLDAPFELCWKRIKNEKQTRPLAANETFARQLFAERRKIYELCDLRIEIGEKDSLENVADRILQRIKTKNN